MKAQQVHYNQQFKRVLAQLNPAQRKAVEHIEGPVMVVAGPGTGKTHILSARIGQILTLTDVYAHNILCLTYTDAGVHAMRERLLAFIGPEAHKVHIFTFHSFCNKIIQDNLDLFGKRDAEPISDLERVELIREMIDELPNHHVLKKLKGNPYFYEKHLSRLFEHMKAENWTAAYAQQQIKKYLQTLPDKPEYIYQVNGKLFKKGDPKKHLIDRETERMELLSAGVALYNAFIQKMNARKRYDFGDMIQWILQAFERNAYLLRRYQEQYLYILVDEFQDTNGAQNRILQLLADFWEQPNIFVVGDDDQSIYEFQGARVQNIMDFGEQFEAVEMVVLQNNYRSSQQILDSAGALIQQNKIRLVNTSDAIQKKLVASSSEVAQSGITPQILTYPNRLHEVTDIALQIEALHRRGVPLTEVAVIYAQHRQAEPLIQLLQSKDIPYHTKKRVNILETPLIINVLSILAYVQTEYERPFGGEKLLFELLYINFFNLDLSDVAELGAYMAMKSREEAAPYWRDMLQDEEMLRQRQLRHPKKILQMMALLTRLIREYRNLPLTRLVELLINRSGLLHHVASHNDKVWLMQVLHTFLSFVETETLKTPTLQIRELLEVIERMNANRLPLSVHQTMFPTDGVQLVTAHSSKGLEFQYVFMLGCEADFWGENKHRSRNQFTLPETLTLTYSATEDAQEAARRLFYVAMTRAKEYLHLSYSQKKNDGKDIKRVEFIDEVVNATNLAIQEKEVHQRDLYQSQLIRLQQDAPPAIPILNKDILDTLLEGFALSPSSLGRYLKCPLTFYFENVLRVPSVSSVAAAYGTAVHNALQRAFQKMRSHKAQAFPSTKDFMADFERELNRQRAYLSDRSFADRLAFGRKILPAYYENRVQEWFKAEVRVELELRHVEIDGVPIKGVVDKIEFWKNYELEVVDYKTGKYDRPKVMPPTERNPLGGEYWRQVVFYKILLENYQNKGWIVTAGNIEYIEPFKGAYKQARFSPISQEHVSIVKEQIKTTYQKIMNHEFSEGCQLPNCHWCNFVKHHHIQDRYMSQVADELDDSA